MLLLLTCASIASCDDFDDMVAWGEQHLVGAAQPRQGQGLKALHTLSAYACHARLVLASLSVPEKTNEINAIPELLDHLAGTGQLQGALVN